MHCFMVYLLCADFSWYVPHICASLVFSAYGEHCSFTWAGSCFKAIHHLDVLLECLNLKFFAAVVFLFFFLIQGTSWSFVVVADTSV